MSNDAFTRSKKPFYKLKNPSGYNEDLSRVNLTLRNSSNPQSSKTISAPARQSCESSASSDRDKPQEPTLQRTSMKLSVQPKKGTDVEYQNETRDDFRPSSQ